MRDARALARVAIAGIVAYVLIDVALVFLRPHFSVLHNAESDYGSKGSYAWLMDVNFLLRCGLSLAAVLAIWRFQRGADAVRSGLVLFAGIAFVTPSSSARGRRRASLVASVWIARSADG